MQIGGSSEILLVLTQLVLAETFLGLVLSATNSY